MESQCPGKGYRDNGASESAPDEPGLGVGGCGGVGASFQPAAVRQECAGNAVRKCRQDNGRRFVGGGGLFQRLAMDLGDDNQACQQMAGEQQPIPINMILLVVGITRTPSSSHAFAIHQGCQQIRASSLVQGYLVNLIQHLVQQTLF